MSDYIEELEAWMLREGKLKSDAPPEPESEPAPEKPRWPGHRAFRGRTAAWEALRMCRRLYPWRCPR